MNIALSLVIAYQTGSENIHSEVYASMLNLFVDDPAERARLTNTIGHIPALGAKAQWCFRWIQDKDIQFAIRLIAFAAVEGIFFTSSFAAISWMKKRGLMPGMTFSNDLISRDEALHTRFACALFEHIMVRPAADVVHRIVGEAASLEKTFATGEIFRFSSLV